MEVMECFSGFSESKEKSSEEFVTRAHLKIGKYEFFGCLFPFFSLFSTRISYECQRVFIRISFLKNILFRNFTDTTAREGETDRGLGINLLYFEFRRERNICLRISFPI